MTDNADFLPSELELVKRLLESDLRMGQRGDLIAAIADGVVWMMDFHGIATSEGFRNVAIETTTRWRIPTSEVRDAIEERLDADGNGNEVVDGTEIVIEE